MKKTVTFLHRKEIEEYVEKGYLDPSPAQQEPETLFAPEESMEQPGMEQPAEPFVTQEPGGPFAPERLVEQPAEQLGTQEPARQPQAAADLAFGAPQGSGQAGTEADLTFGAPQGSSQAGTEADLAFGAPQGSGQAGARTGTESASEAGAESASEAEEHIPTVAEEIRTLALKIMFVLAAFFVVFTFIFGLHRNLSVDMQPSLRDGDLLFYYRLDKDYRANNIVVFDYKDEMIASRVIAVPGDTVNITDKGLEINGNVMIEPEIYSQTTQFKGGPTFPLTVEEGTVFVLGDNREHANDSRIIGLIQDDDIKGKVMGVVRRRNL